MNYNKYNNLGERVEGLERGQTVERSGSPYNQYDKKMIDAPRSKRGYTELVDGKDWETLRYRMSKRGEYIKYKKFDPLSESRSTYYKEKKVYEDFVKRLVPLKIYYGTMLFSIMIKHAILRFVRLTKVLAKIKRIEDNRYDLMVEDYSDNNEEERRYIVEKAERKKDKEIHVVKEEFGLPGGSRYGDVGMVKDGDDKVNYKGKLYEFLGKMGTYKISYDVESKFNGLRLLFQSSLVLEIFGITEKYKSDDWCTTKKKSQQNVSKMCYRMITSKEYDFKEILKKRLKVENKNFKNKKEDRLNKKEKFEISSAPRLIIKDGECVYLSRIQSLCSYFELPLPSLSRGIGDTNDQYDRKIKKLYFYYLSICYGENYKGRVKLFLTMCGIDYKYTIHSRGPDHQREYQATIETDVGFVFGELCSTIKDAEQDAAMRFCNEVLLRIKKEGESYVCGNLFDIERFLNGVSDKFFLGPEPVFFKEKVKKKDKDGDVFVPVVDQILFNVYMGSCREVQSRVKKKIRFFERFDTVGCGSKGLIEKAFYVDDMMFSDPVENPCHYDDVMV